MSQLPSWRRIIQQDYPQEDQQLVGQLALPINWGMDTLFGILSNGLTFASNIASTINTFQVIVDSNGNPTTNITIPKSNTNTLIGIVVVKAVNNTKSNVYPTAAPFVSYTETTSNIIINNISGLQANNNYSITILGIN